MKPRPICETALARATLIRSEFRAAVEADEPFLLQHAAERHGCTRELVRHYLLGRVAKDPAWDPAYYEEHRSQNRPPAYIAEVRRRFLLGERSRDIARDLGLPVDLAWAICTNRERVDPSYVPPERDNNRNDASRLRRIREAVEAGAQSIGRIETLTRIKSRVITRICRENGILLQGCTPASWTTSEEREYVRALAAKGYDYAAIARHMNWSWVRVRHQIERTERSIAPRRKTLTRKDLDRIDAYHRAGRSQNFIAEKLRMGRATVRKGLDLLGVPRKRLTSAQLASYAKKGRGRPAEGGQS